MFPSESFQGKERLCQLSSRLYICHNFHFRLKSSDLLIKYTYAHIIWQWDSLRFQLDLQHKMRIKHRTVKIHAHFPSKQISPPSNSSGTMPKGLILHTVLQIPGQSLALALQPPHILGLPYQVCPCLSILSHCLSQGPHRTLSTCYYSPFSFSSIKTTSHA